MCEGPTEIIANQAQRKETASSVSVSGGSTSSRTQEFTQMKPPVFTGTKAKEDPQNFIDGLQKVFRIMHSTETEAVEFGVFQFQDVAHIWYESWEQSRGEDAPPATWDEFVDAFLDHFIPIEVREAKAIEFKRLRQNNMTVQEYYHKFVSLAKHAPHMVPDTRVIVRRFLLGLKSDLHGDANMAAQNNNMTIAGWLLLYKVMRTE
ncbi:uncharacterized protein LOC132039145 [Lycium ferocissimum]|uniref:uncharacterized protein LOC132039145 n=1 Tax=Lycium ferocissimum TaxID=112874 RepID=UPI0028168266|nr:uncharacterized protein LOC132039145 [Lycium ferocissimum]